MAEETNHNQAGEVAPSTVDKQAPDVAEEHAPSTDSDKATDIPSANAPDPNAVNSDANANAVGEKPTAEAQLSTKSSQTSVKEAAKSAKATPAAEKPAGAKKPAADKADAGEEAPAKAAKKEKAPAVEDKPFADFIEQDFLPALKTALEKQGAKDLNLKFAKEKILVAGFKQAPECWQIMGSWQSNRHNFNLYFPEENIQGKRAFSCNEGSKPSTIEPFLCDERKITLDLMVFGVVQRLAGQKWLVRN